MRNYLKAELFRNFHRKYLWGFIASIIGCGLLGCLGFEYMNHNYEHAHLTLEVLLLIGIMILPAYMYLMMLFADLTIGEEFKHNTIKNITSSGLSRAKIYVCKVIESIILMIFCTVISFIGVILIGYLILGVDNGAECMSLLQDCLMRGLISITLWSGASAIAILIFTLVKGENMASFIYIGIAMFAGETFSLLGTYINPIFKHVEKYLLSTQLTLVSTVESLSSEISIVAVITGLLYTIVFTIIGIGVLNKKDV